MKLLETNFLEAISKFWTQSIRNGYVRSHLIFAMHETGVFESLKNNDHLSSEELAKKNKLNPVLP